MYDISFIYTNEGTTHIHNTLTYKLMCRVGSKVIFQKLSYCLMYDTLTGFWEDGKIGFLSVKKVKTQFFSTCEDCRKKRSTKHEV